MLAIGIIGGAVISIRTMPRLKSRATIWIEVLKHEPDNMFAMMCQGCVEFNRGKHDSGLEKMQTAFQARPDLKMGVISYATALEDMGYRKRIVDVYREAVKSNPTEPMMLYNLGYWLERSGKPNQAIDAYRSAVTYAPDDQAARTNLASLLADAGDLEAAVPHFQAAAKIQPDFVNQMNLLTVYLQLGQTESANRVVKDLLVAARAEGKEKVAERIQRGLEELKAANP